MEAVSGATQLAFLPDGGTVAALCTDGGVRFVDVHKGEVVAEVRRGFLSFLSLCAILASYCVTNAAILLTSTMAIWHHFSISNLKLYKDTCKHSTLSSALPFVFFAVQIPYMFPNQKAQCCFSMDTRCNSMALVSDGKVGVQFLHDSPFRKASTLT